MYFDVGLIVLMIKKIKILCYKKKSDISNNDIAKQLSVGYKTDQNKNVKKFVFPPKQNFAYRQ